MAWNGLWWWRRIFAIESASAEGSRLGRLRDEKGRIWRERTRVWIILKAIDGFIPCIRYTTQFSNFATALVKAPKTTRNAIFIKFVRSDRDIEMIYVIF